MTATAQPPAASTGSSVFNSVSLLRLLRKRSGKTGVEIAKELGASQNSTHYYFSRKRDPVSLTLYNLQRLVKLLGGVASVSSGVPEVDAEMLKEELGVDFCKHFPETVKLRLVSREFDAVLLFNQHLFETSEHGQSADSVYQYFGIDRVKLTKEAHQQKLIEDGA